MPPKKANKMSPAAIPAKVAAPAITPAPAPMPVVERSEVKGLGKPKVPVTPPATPKVITHDEIAKRAFEIYANRGYTPGDPNADWHEAERQLRAGL